MSHDEQVEHAKTICLNTLTMVARTRSQLADKLAEKGVPDDVAEEALNRLSEVGLIDDAAYARTYAASRHSGRGLAAGAIRRELSRKGVDAELIDDAVETIDSDAEQSRAIELVRRKAPSTRNLERQVRTRRLVGMLARKGYNGSIAYGAVRTVLDEEHGQSDDYLESGED
jgi:regulatory protein